jgi:3D (Asp-Asp-Asp) domain-containing protein
VQKNKGVQILNARISGYFGPIRSEYPNYASYLKDAKLNGKGEITSSGTKPTIGTIAADPKHYKPGTKIFIPSVNFLGTVEDSGPAIKGPYRFDLFCGHGKNAKKIALTWDAGQKTTVHIIKKTRTAI